MTLFYLALQKTMLTLQSFAMIIALPTRAIIQQRLKIMSHFDQYIQYRALRFKFSTVNDDLSPVLEQAIEDGQTSLPLRNVCAKLSPELVDRLDNSLSILGITKRQFIEMALVEALDRVDQELHDIDAFEFAQQASE